MFGFGIGLLGYKRGRDEVDDDSDDSDDESKIPPQIRSLLRGRKPRCKLLKLRKRSLKWVKLPGHQCAKCKAICKLKDVSSHLDACFPVRNGRSANAIRGKIIGCEGLYQIQFAMDLEADFSDLDIVIRDLWCSDCEHLSKFTLLRTPEKPLQVPPTDCGDGYQRVFSADGIEKSKSINNTIDPYFEPNKVIRYDYDYGDTSTLHIVLEAKVNMARPLSSGEVKVLMRNEPPQFICSCKRRATEISDSRGLGPQTVFCQQCSEPDETHEITNTPRIGYCCV